MNEVIDLYKKSKKWDHVKDPKELFEGVGTVFIDLCYSRHKDDDGHGCVEIYLPRSDKEHTYTEIGIDFEGLTYDGDMSTNQLPEDSVYELPVDVALTIIHKYSKIIDKVYDLSTYLGKIPNMKHDLVGVQIMKYYK